MSIRTTWDGDAAIDFSVKNSFDQYTDQRETTRSVLGDEAERLAHLANKAKWNRGGIFGAQCQADLEVAIARASPEALALVAEKLA